MWCCRNVPETWRSSVALIAALLFVLPVPAQDAPPKESEPGAKPPEPKTVAEVLKDSDRIDGLFTLYRDRKTGALRMALTADELEKTYLYFTYTENGVPAAGQFRGAFGMSRADVFRVSRYYDRIEFIVENTSYYFDAEQGRLPARRMPTSAMPSPPRKKSKPRTPSKASSSSTPATCFSPRRSIA